MRSQEERPASDASLLVLALLLAAANAWTWTEVLLRSQNTLLLNDRWASTKRTLELGVMGSDSFLLSRAALHRDRLNLASWHGCNEVLRRRPFKPGAIGFDFKLAPGAVLNVVFNKTPAGFSGLRIGADPARDGLFFRASSEGRFISTRELPLAAPADRWHSLKLGFDAGRLGIELDGREAGSVEEAALDGQVFGFRGGFGEALIDNVVIKDAGGLVEREDFSNRQGGARALALNAGGLLLLGAAAAAVRAWRQKPLRSTLLGLASANAVLAAVGAALLLFDAYYWSRLPLDSRSKRLSGPDAVPFQRAVESVRYALFARWQRLAGGRVPGKADLILQGYPGGTIWAGPVFCGSDPESPAAALDEPGLEALLARRKTAYRLLFVGSSQTIGAGARNLSETFFARIHRSLAASFGPKFPIESLNSSVSGANAADSFDAYRRVYRRFKPDLVVINFTVNGGPEALRSGLEGYLRANRAEGISTILIKEAVARGTLPGDPRMLRKKRLVEDSAREFAAPVYDLDTHLNDPRVDSTGFLWWDSVHLTSHGQAVAAEWLAPRIAAAIRRRSRT